MDVAHAPGVELKPTSDGLYKVSSGRSTKLSGSLPSNTAISSDGKWAIAEMSDPSGNGRVITRFNLMTDQALNLPDVYRYEFGIAAYIPTANKFLLLRRYRSDDYEGRGRNRPLDIRPDPKPSEMCLVDPATGAIQPVAGEMAPFSQQTYRPLQKGPKPNEFWAAIPDVKAGSTRVGVVNTNDFGFATSVQIPSMIFNNMSMWVDVPGGKFYFVYRGQLLSLPLKR